MKKIVCIVLSIYLLLALTACFPLIPGGNKDRTTASTAETVTEPDAGTATETAAITEAETEIAETEEETTIGQEDSTQDTSGELDVDILDFFIAVRFQDGEWHCPGQYNLYSLRFDILQDGDYVVIMSMSGRDNAELIAVIDYVTRDKANGIYTLHLSDYNVPVKYEELTVDTSSADAGYIDAGNIYDDNKTVEYVLTPINTGETRRWINSSSILITEPEYFSWLEIYPDGTFVLQENLLEGFGQFIGWSERSGSELILHVTSTDPEWMPGSFSNADATTIRFTQESEYALRLEQDLVSSWEGDLFSID